MDIVDRLIAHDACTTRQLLLACKALPEAALDEEFEIDHRSLRKTFAHMIGNIEVWTDLMVQRPVERRQGRSDDGYLDVLEQPPKWRTFGGTIGHVITHNMHHRAQVMFLMEKAGLTEHIEGDLLSWEANSFGW